ncbi:hypothetical protein TcBrA4_0051830 [Trypanosoma cruzi]|nr:hypothetical protein TcBrA4_0051830 [Trypanosoma cruzi]
MYLPRVSTLYRIGESFCVFSPPGALLGAEPLHLKEKPRQLLGEARPPHLPSIHAMFFSWWLQRRCGGAGADLSLRMVHVDRFRKARPMPVACRAGGGSVRHCCGAESRMLDGEIRPVAIPSACRRRETCAFSRYHSLCRPGIRDSGTLMNGCVRAILGKRRAVPRRPPSEAKYSGRFGLTPVVFQALRRVCIEFPFLAP